MPSWWRRNFQQHEGTLTRTKSKIKNRVRAKSFDEAIVMTRGSPRTSQDDFEVAPDRFSRHSMSCVITGSGIAQKKDYPLPLPLPPNSLEQSGSTASTTSSGSSVSSDAEELHVDSSLPFASFRTLEESKSKSRTCKQSTSSTTGTSPESPGFWGTDMESPRGKPIKYRHPGHPLPLPPNSPSKPPEIQQSLNSQPKWRKGRLLGRGTFGHVYAGLNSENGQMCAIKEVKIISDDQTSTECLKQLKQEIALLSQFSHPNIVQYYDSELEGDKLSVHLEYVSGGSILKLLQEYGPFGELVIRSYTRKVLSGLAYLHEKNTAHRDIKGANILVTPKGDIKLADFGMAKHTPSCSSMLSFRGSPYWMAPEIITNNGGYSPAVDIWSLGCTVLEMATSKPPWSQYEGVAAIFKIANGKDFPEMPNILSDDAKSFIRLCLQRNPCSRPTAAQLLRHPFMQEI